MNPRSFSPFILYLLSIILFSSLSLQGVTAVPTNTVAISYEPSATATGGVVPASTGGASSTATAIGDSPSSTASPSSGGSASPVPSVIVPKAFDTSIPSENFTSYTCYPFFTSFLANQSFTDCYPLSFFLQNSKSWFNILREGEVAVTQALDTSCKVDFQKCQAVMADLGRQLLSPNNCGQEFKARNPTVTQAYASFITYGELFSVGCLKDKKSGNYCYAEAATNGQNVANTYIYFLPLGLQLPGGSSLTCSSCLQQTMMIYASEAGNQSMPLYSTYSSSAQQIDIGCGPNFVNTTASEESSSSSLWSIGSSRWLSCITLITSVILLVA